MRRNHAGVYVGTMIVLLAGAILLGCGGGSSHSDPEFLVAANQNLTGAAGNLTLFSINLTSGALTPVNSSNTAPLQSAVDNPWGLVVHPNGQWVFIASASNTNLQGLSPSATGVASLGTATGSAPVAQFNSQMAIDPQGTHLFTAHSNPVIDIFPISSAGALGSNSPFTVPGSTAVFGVAATTGFVYAAEGHATTPDIYVMSNSGGTLTAQSTVTVPTAHVLQAIAVSPNQNLLAVGTTNGEIWVYTINSSTGALTPAFTGSIPSATLSTGTNPPTAEKIVFSPDSTAMYVAAGDAELINTFAVSAGGTLSGQNSTITASAQYPDTLAADPQGKFVYAGISSTFGPTSPPEIMGFTLSGSTLTPIAGTNPSPYPIPGGNPLSIGVAQ